MFARQVKPIEHSDTETHPSEIGINRKKSSQSPTWTAALGESPLLHPAGQLMQQGKTAPAPTAKTAPAPPTKAAPPAKNAAAAHADEPAACDTSLIDPAYNEARRWRRQVSRWFESHLAHIQMIAGLTRGDGPIRVGAAIVRDLALLDRHFRISDEIRHRRSLFPTAASDFVTIRDLQNFANASYWIRRRFDDVELGSLDYQCQVNAPRLRSGRDVLGSAAPGSRRVTFYTRPFSAQSDTTRAGVAMHEAFHASFSEFDHDTYSFDGSYPGGNPMTNAESYAMFAAYVATGGTYRIIQVPEMLITAPPPAR